MNKKVLLIAVALLAVAILATPFVGTAMAGKGQEKLYYEMNVTNIAYGIPEVRTAPPEATPNVVFLTLTEVYSEDFSLQIGSQTFYPDRSAVVEIIMNQRQSFVLARVHEIYTFDGVDGTIEVSLTGRINYYYTPDAMSDMVVVGHGTGYFEGVKIMAEGHNEEGNLPQKIHKGTIMGWSGLP